MKSYIAITLLLLCGCIKYKNANNDNSIFLKAQPTDSLTFYFPPILNDTFTTINPRYKNFVQNWYSSTLYSFKEPILFNKDIPHTIYRLLWIRSFHDPVCFSMTQVDNKFYLNAKTLDKIPAFYPEIEGSYSKEGKLILDTVQKADRLANITFNRILPLEKRDWMKSLEFIDKLNFWEIPSLDPEEDDSTDGANWILEGVKEGKYHFIDRRNATGNLRKLGEYLIKLSNLNIPEEDIY